MVGKRAIQPVSVLLNLPSICTFCNCKNTLKYYFIKDVKKKPLKNSTFKLYF